LRENIGRDSGESRGGEDGRLQEIEEQIGKVFQNILDLALHRGRKGRRSSQAVKPLVKAQFEQIVGSEFQQWSCEITCQPFIQRYIAISEDQFDSWHCIWL
jgi:hypothetical protein